MKWVWDQEAGWTCCEHEKALFAVVFLCGHCEISIKAKDTPVVGLCDDCLDWALSPEIKKPCSLCGLLDEHNKVLWWVA